MTGYYTSHLKHAQSKRFADKLAEQLICPAFPKSLVTLGRLTDEPNMTRDVTAAIYAVTADHPELFFLGGAYEIWLRGHQVQLALNFLYSNSDIALYQKELNRLLRYESSKITAAANNKIEREMALYKYLCETVTYVDDGKPERQNLVGALLEGKAVCSGISQAFTYIARAVGIPAITVIGSTSARSTGLHSWNMVQINNLIAHVDATWGATEMGVDWGYFNLTDEQIRRDHTPNLLCLPKCISPVGSYFSIYGADAQDEQQLVSMIRCNVRRGARQMQFRLKNGDIQKAAERAIRLLPGRYRYRCNPTQNTIQLARL